MPRYEAACRGRMTCTIEFLVELEASNEEDVLQSLSIGSYDELIDITEQTDVDIEVGDVLEIQLAEDHDRL